MKLSLTTICFPLKTSKTVPYYIILFFIFFKVHFLAAEPTNKKKKSLLLTTAETVSMEVTQNKTPAYLLIKIKENVALFDSLT